MSDLFVSTHTPVLRSGRAVRTYGVVRALAAHGPLDLLYVRFEGEEPDAAFSSIGGVRMHEVVSSRGAARLLAFARGRVAGVPKSIARGISPELAAAASRMADDPGRGRVIADGPGAAATLIALSRRRPVIYNAHNFESGFRHELGVAAVGSPEKLRAFERGVLERACESWMVSETDLAAARELCPQATLRYVPNVVDTGAIVPLAQPARNHRAIFVANFSYKPNADGLRFLLERVLPLVWSELPDARLALVGAGLDAGLELDPRVEPLGFVDDLRDAYADAACALVPLLVGGGTPLKLLEALAYGLPVIATPRAVAGLDVRDGEHCLVADSPEAFAAALARALRGEADELAVRGRALVLERYSIAELSRLLAS